MTTTTMTMPAPGQSRRQSESTVQEDESTSMSARTSVDTVAEKRGGDEEMRTGGDSGDNGIVRSSDEIARMQTHRTADSARPHATHSKSLRSIKSHHSRAGADGYTCFDRDDEGHDGHDHEKEQSGGRPNKSTGATGAQLDEDPHLVRWEGGDADPMNPRSMTTLRRWCIVLIVSASSLCV